MYVRAAEVEGPVSVMAIGALEVRVRRGMRLHITSSSLIDRRVSYAEEGMYDGRVGVPGPAAEVGCPWNLSDGRRDKMMCIVRTYQRKRGVGRTHLVDKSDVGLDGMQTIVNVEGLATNVGTR
jgi:hypothetical protein